VQLLLIGLVLYAVASSKPSSTTTPAPKQPTSAPPGSNFASDLGSFVAGFIVAAEEKYGKDDSP